MPIRRFQAAVILLLVLPLLIKAVFIEPEPLLAQPVLGNGLIGPFNPLLIDTNGDGQPTPGVDHGIMLTRIGNVVTAESPFDCNADGDNQATLGSPDPVSGRFTALNRFDDYGRRDEITFDYGLDFRVSKINYNKWDSFNFNLGYGVAEPRDTNADGVMDTLFADGLTNSFGLRFSMGYSMRDVTGDNRPDFASVPWSYAAFNIQPTRGCPMPGAGGQTPQVWLPLWDSNGDGTRDTVAFDLNGDGNPDTDLLMGQPVMPGPTRSTLSVPTTMTVIETTGGNANAAVNVTLTPASAQVVTVEFFTFDVTATAPADYVATTGTLTFNPGDTVKTVNIPIVGDSTAEPTETFDFLLTPNTQANVAPGDTRINILDNETRQLTITDISQQEGNAGVSNMVFTVSLGLASAQTVTVQYATANGLCPYPPSCTYLTATSPADYTATSGTLTFAPGDLTKTIAVPIVGETTPEIPETFLVNLTNATGNAVIGDPQGIGTINNDDGTMTGTKTVSGSFRPSGTITYTVVLTNAGPATQFDNAFDEFTDVLPATLTLVSATATSGTAVATVGTNTVTWNGSLAPAATATITITATIKATSGGLTIGNQGTLRFDADGNFTNESQGLTDDPGVSGATNVTFLTVGIVTMTGTKVKSGSVLPSGTITYTVVLSNGGNVTQTDNPGNEFTDVLPAQVTLVSATATAGTAVATVATNTVTWNGSIAAAASVTVTITATIKATTVGTVSNQGTLAFDADVNGTNEASGLTDDPAVAGAANPTSFTVVANVTMTGTKVKSGSVLPSGTITYTVVLSNGGNVGQGDNPGNEFTDVLPTQLTLVSATATAGAAVATVATNTVTWNGSIAAAASVTVTITATIKATTVGTVSNQGTLAFDADVNGTNEASGLTDDPAVAGAANPTSFTVGANVTMTGTKVKSGSVLPSGTITYTVVLSNGGNAPQTDNPGNEFTDVLPAQLTLVSATATGGTAVATVATNTVTWNGSIAAAASVTVTITATIKAATAPGQTVSNQGTLAFDADVNGTNEASALTDDPGVAGAANPTSFTVGSGGTVTMTGTKAVAGTFEVGGTITYTVVLSNGGNATQGDNPGHEFTDVLPDTLTLVSATATAGTAVAVLADNAVTWNGSIAAAASVTVTITATIRFTAAGKNVVNQGNIIFDADVNGTNEVGTVTNMVSFAVPGRPTVTIDSINDVPFAPNLQVRSSFGTLRGLTSSFDPAESDPRAGAVTGVTWASDRGPTGTATGTANWQAAVPLFAGANVITVTATDAGGLTGTAVVTINVNAMVYYLAEGATGPFFDLELLIANPNAVDAPVAIQYLKDDGTTVNQTLTVPAQRHVTILVDSLAGLTDTAVSSVVTSTNALPLAVERTMIWDARRYGAHTDTATGGARLDWLFAEGSQGFFDTFLLLANPQATASSATVTFLVEGGAPVTRVVPLAPTSRTNVYAGAIPELVNRSFGMTVTFTQPGVAERAMYFGTTTHLALTDPNYRLWNGGHESAGANEASTNWFLAEGATGPFFDTFVLLSNPTAASVVATLTFLLDTGAPIVRTFTVPANGRTTVNIEDVPGMPVGATTRGVATQITAPTPILVERAMYWPGAFSSWYEAHNALGSTGTGTKWALGEGRVGGPSNYETYILLANPGATAATVTVTYLREGAAPIVKPYTVPATSRVNVVPALDGLSNESFGALITSTQPIAIERALYASPGGVFWAAGTNANATRIP